ncbi:MAG: ComF family protein [Candidatus Auribacterota bacterium]|nr:ComF family protein [Candidatus Auribacterota bacterium]
MKIRYTYQNSLLWFLHLFFPKECVHCGRILDYRNREYLCFDCRKLIIPVRPPLCEQCGRPFSGEIENPIKCTDCREDPPRFRRARSAFLLDGAGRSLVLKYKYSRNPYLSSPAIDWLLEIGEEEYDWSDYDLVVPVPLHPRKARERGFNQSAVLASGLSRRTGIKLSRKGLIRTRYTGTQTRLSRNDRRENVRGAFRASESVELKGKSVLLVDDVYTTGATVNECAGVLIKAGVSMVDVLTLARAG